MSSETKKDDKNEGTLSSLQLNTAKQSDTMKLPLWAIVAICVGGTALVTTGLLLLMHFIGKRIRNRNAKKEASRLLQENKMFF